MIYIMSDIHGELGLFRQMLKLINFGKNDRLIIAGDVVDKGSESAALLRFIYEMKNVVVILGNHDYDFLKVARDATRDCKGGADFDAALEKLRCRFADGELLSWELIDYMESWPTYYEEDSFFAVHAGMPLDGRGYHTALADATTEQLVNDRRFRNANYRGKTAFFGHTETPNNKIVAFSRRRDKKPVALSDYSKIWLDCGAWHTGVLGAFCIDNLKCYYVKKKR